MPAEEFIGSGQMSMSFRALQLAGGCAQSDMLRCLAFGTIDATFLKDSSCKFCRLFSVLGAVCSIPKRLALTVSMSSVWFVLGVLHICWHKTEVFGALPLVVQ
eukprot:3564056-Amphidinium_carterae.1